MQIDTDGKRDLEVGCGLGLGSLGLSSRGAGCTSEKVSNVLTLEPWPINSAQL